MKKYVLTIDVSYQTTKEELDEVERDFIDFLYNARRHALVLGPGVTLTVLDVDVDEPCRLVVDGNRVEKQRPTVCSGGAGGRSQVDNRMERQ